MSKLTLAELRAKHARFVFSEFEFAQKNTDLEVTFHFILETGLHFHPTLLFKNLNWERYQSLDQKLIREWLFRIGMVELLSYWKAACPAEIVIQAGYLTEHEVSFWQKLLQNGMSEFFFVNQIDGWQPNFVHLNVEASAQPYDLDKSVKANQVLVPVGGGKDSVVTVETLKKSQLSLALFTVNKSAASERIAQISGVQTKVEVIRSVDPQILSLNDQGYLNGHTPFSSLLAFVSTFSAYLFDYSDVALSNEWSANEGNIIFLGHTVNHQYSKSLEFEQDFRQYLKEYLSSTVNYFSFLRPIHELQIAQLFSGYSKYFPVFLSCNRGYRADKWCGECPKCLFTAIILSPFLSSDQIKQIFKKDILNDQTLLPILQELSGLTELKSLECVGTRDETRAALAVAIKKMDPEHLPALFLYAQKNILANDSTSQENAVSILSSYQTNHFLPPELDQLLKKELNLQ